MSTRKTSITKQRIVDAAVEVFSMREFHEATMRDIARKLGISQSNIYQYFESKESVIFHVLTEQIKEMKISMQQQLLGIRGTQNKLRKFAWYYLQWHEDHRRLSWVEYISVNIKAWSDAAPVWELSMEVLGLFGDILREGIKNGEVRPDINIRIAGHMFIGAIRGVIIFWLVGRQFKNPTEEAADTIADYIWDVIKIPGSDFKCPFAGMTNTGRQAKRKRGNFDEQCF